MNRNYYQTPKPSQLMKLLWQAAGGDKYLLERATYADQMKYMCLGGVILSTGVMAGLAGGYAFYTIFSPKGLDAVNLIKTIEVNPNYIPLHIPTVITSIIFGFLWGLLIFNIDRFIVTSTGKGDGTEAITWQELKGAIPRIVMGSIIALTISKPVEIRMFESEINAELQVLQDQKASKRDADDRRDYLKATEEYRRDMIPYESLIKTKETQKVKLDSLVNYEISHGGCKDKCEEFKNQRLSIVNQINDVKNNDDYVRLKNLIKAEDDQKVAKKEKVRLGKTALNGLLIRLQLAHKIAGFWISFFITLLFLAIELTPIFFKLMLVKTPYDFLEDNVKELIKAENGIEVRYDHYQDKEGQERNLVINHQTVRIIYEKIKATEAQKELIDFAIEKYIAEQKQNIADNPEQYIKNS